MSLPHFLCRSSSGILCLLLLVFCSVILATWSLPLEDDNSSSHNTKLRQRRYYQNEYDRPLLVECGPGDSFSRVISRHHNRREDRIWRWECRRLISSNPSQAHCVWSHNVNNHDQPISFSCGANGYLNGVESHHSNRHEDRVWSFKCCSHPHHITWNCHNTGYVNYWDGPMNYQVPAGKVINGVYSFHNNHRE